MKKEIRTVCYDEDLKIEAYRFQGIAQAFPNHFHDYYVIGFIEEGERPLTCRNKDHIIGPGNIILFHPGDTHECVQRDGGTLDYRAIHITKDVMLELAEEVTGKKELTGFSANVICEEEPANYLRPLHQKIMEGSGEFEKEENLLLLVSHLIGHYGQPFESVLPEYREEIEDACRYMEQHYHEHICLEQIGRATGLSKSTLLRAFTKSRGMTPYRYLQAYRINEAKKLLEQGVSVLESAMRTGFSDQSHFTNFFNMFIGLTPGAYREIFMGKNSSLNESSSQNGGDSRNGE